MRTWFEKFMKTVWPSVKAQLVEHLKGKAVRLALKTFLKSAAATGPIAWFIAFVVEEGLIEQIGIPLINAVQVEVVFVYDRETGKVMAKKLNQAREDGNAEAYDAAADDIMS